jgi:hypothetical protein
LVKVMNPAQDSPYRIPTRRVEAEIEIEGSRREEVIFFLATASVSHEGPETMDEALNRIRRFVPVRSRDQGELFLVRRKALTTVSVGRAEGPRLLETVDGLSSSIDFIYIELRGGEILEGALATVLPPENRRISDYFNFGDALFVPLLVGENVVYVNKEFITLVRL